MIIEPGNFGYLVDLNESEKNRDFTSAGDGKFRAIARTKSNPLQFEEGEKNKRECVYAQNEKEKQKRENLFVVGEICSLI